MTLYLSVAFKSQYRTAWHVAALWLLLAWLHGEAATLQQALDYRDQGRGFKALEILQALHKADPASSRIKLETALVRIQLRNYEQASALLEDVLSQPDLPSKVRVNAQLLLLKTRRLQQERQEAAFGIGLIAGVSHHSRFEQTLADGSATLRLNHALSPLNLAGYPVTLHWINQGVLGFIHEPVLEESTALVDLSSQLELSRGDYWLRPGVDTRLAGNDVEPGWNLAGGWRATSSLALTGHIERRWQADGDALFRRWLKLSLFEDRSVRLGLHLLNRSEASNGQWLNTHRLGVQFALHGTRRWTFGGDWALGDAGGQAEQELFILGKIPVFDNLALTTDLRYIEFTDDTAGWFTRLGFSWQR